MDSNSENNLISVGDNISTAESRWTFAGEVAKNFDQHVKKSVPFYQEAHSLTVSLSDLCFGDAPGGKESVGWEWWRIV